MNEYVLALGTIVAVVGLAWKIAHEMKKACDVKISRMYARFDEHKEHMEDTHVSKEVHDLKYDQMKETMDEIKTDVKELLNRGKSE